MEKPMEGNSTEESSVLRRGAIRRYINTTLIAAGALAGFGVGKDNGAEAVAQQAPQTTTSYTEKAGGKDWSWSIYHTFFKKNAQGQTVFNPGAFIVPFELTATKESKKSGVAEIVVPYEFARQFDSAKSLDPNAAQKMEDYIRQQLLQTFGEQVHNYGFFFTDGVLQAKRQLDTGLGTITSIGITGSSSPESGSPDSLIPGNIDPRNEALAAKRAADVGTMIPQEVPAGAVANARIEGQEAQFSNEELTALNDLATQYHNEKEGRNDAPSSTIDYVKIFDMVRDFNSGKLGQEAPQLAQTVQDTLTEVVSSKRNVELEVKGESSQKETYVIPLPLTLLLLLLPLMRRRTPPPVPPPTPPPLPDIITEPLPFPTVPENSESGEYWVARQQTLRDLVEAFDNEEAVRLGVNYRALCELVEANFDRFRTHEDRITWTAQQILEQWATCDARKWTTEKPHEFDEVYKKIINQYKNDPKQLLFALLHARELNDAILDSRTTPDAGANRYINTIHRNYTMAYNETADAVMRPGAAPHQ